MKRSMIRLGAAILCAGLVAGQANAGVTRRDRHRARVAVGYLVSQQQPDGSWTGGIGFTADAIVSMVAARRAPGAINRALDHLVANEGEVDTVGERAKVVLALVAAGRNATDFAGRDLVEELRSLETGDGRFGDGTSVVDHALAMLALAGAGSMPSDAAAAWLASAQCPIGGWQYDAPWSDADDNEWCKSDGEGEDWFIAETDATSYAIQALQVHPGHDTLKRNPFRFLRETRDRTKNGWGYNSDYPLTSANSTSLAIQAFVAGGRTLPKGAKRALRQLQYKPCKHRAAFAFTWEEKPGGGYKRSGPDVIATIDGIRGLLERPLPVRHRSVTKRPPVPAC